MKITPGRFGLFTSESLAAYLEKYPAPENSREIKYDQETQLFRLTEAPAVSAATKRHAGIIEKAVATSQPGGIKRTAGGSAKRIIPRFIPLEKDDFGPSTQTCKSCERVGRLTDGNCAICYHAR